MKRILTLLILLGTFLVPSLSQWQIISAGDLDPIGDTSLNDIYFLNRDTGFITGGEVHLHGGAGSIFKTTDGGKSWGSIYHSSFFSPRQIQFTNETTAYFNSDGAWWDGTRMFRTLDGGESWHEILDVASGGFSFVSEDIGFVTQWENVLRTSTAGNSWDTIYNGCTDTRCVYISSSFFLHQGLGWLLTGNDTLIRYNAPDTWLQIPLEDIEFPTQVQFLNENTGWMTAGYHYNEDDYRFGLYKTYDGGLSWDSVPGIDFLINDIYFENDYHAWAVGKDANGQGLIKETYDQGLSWAPCIDKLPGTLRRIISRQGQLWAIGEHGLILKYTSTPYWVKSAELVNDPPYLIPGEGIADIQTSISNPEGHPLNVQALFESTDGETEVTQAMNYQGGDLWTTEWMARDSETFYKLRLNVERSDISGSSFSYSMGIPFTTAGPVAVQDYSYKWYEGYMTDTIPNPGDTVLLSLNIINKGITDSISRVGMRLSSEDDLVTTLWGGLIDTWRPIAPGETILFEIPIIISPKATPHSLIPVEVDFYSMNRYYWHDTFHIALEGYNPLPIIKETPFSVFPNPAGDYIHLVQEGNENNHVLIEIIDLSGKRIIQQEVMFSGRDTKEFNVSGLEPGIYLVNITSKQRSYQLKLLKQ